MSADNGIYILKTGGQYRVKHLQCADNLYWDERSQSEKCLMQPNMISLMFGKNSRIATTKANALKIAKELVRSCDICEFGIVFLDARMTWEQIMVAAMDSRLPV